jgi:hypothetical protein
MKTNAQIAEIFNKHRKISRAALSAQYQNTQNCFAFYNGEPQRATELVQFVAGDGRKKRAQVNFNNIQSNIDVVCGFMAQNRGVAKFIARVPDNQAQELYSKNMNALYAFHREKQHADQIESQQNLEMLVCGYGATDVDISYIVGNASTDPNGDILKTNIDPESAYWDPAARAKNLTDRRWSGYPKEFALQEALSLFQNSTKDDFEDVSPSDNDRGYSYNPYGGRYDKIKAENSVEWASEEQDIVRVYKHEWFEYEDFYRAKNPVFEAADPVDALFFKAKLDIIASSQIPEESGNGIITVKDAFDFDPTAPELTFDDTIRKQLLDDFGDLVKPVSFKRKCFYTAVVSGQHVFTWFKSISQRAFTINFKTGSYNRTGGFWIGMVNPMIEPQKYSNKALTELMFTIAANSKGGVLIEEDAVEDIADFENKYAKTDGVIVVRSGALAQGKIQPKAQSALPTGLENIIQLSDMAMAQAGVDPAMMGSIDKVDQSGVLFKRRIRQVISKMAKYFDSIELYQKDDALIHADMIPVWIENNNGQFVRITGTDGANEFVQITENMVAPEYDVTVLEAPQSPEDRQETAQAIIGLGDKIAPVDPQKAMALYAEALTMLPLDGDKRQAIAQILRPSEDLIPAAQAQQQIQMLMSQIQQLQNEVTKAQLDKTRSETEKNLAQVQKTQADAANAIEEAKAKNVETSLMTTAQASNISVVI